MVFYRAAVGGGSATSTTLWTNPSPTSNFSAQTVTLSQDMNNFDYLKITWRYNSENSSIGEQSCSMLMPVNDLINNGTHSTKTKNKFVINIITSANYNNYRFVEYSSNTGVYIGAGSNAASYSIPTKIEGIKFM